MSFSNQKIILNCSTNVIGGAIQVSYSLVKHSLHSSQGLIWYYIFSKEVYENVRPYLKSIPRYRYIVINTSPAKIVSGYKDRVKILGFEREVNPNAVFTVFGPAYVNFKNMHLCGFADGWVTHPNSLIYQNLNIFQRLYTILRGKYKTFFLSKSGYYWVENEISKNGLACQTGIDKERISVIPNTPAEIFWDNLDEKSYDRTVQGPITRIATIAAPHVNKNLIIIPEVLQALLKKLGVNASVEFHVTIPEGTQFYRNFMQLIDFYHLENCIVNHGYLTVAKCKDLLVDSDVLFMPTLLETSSATYYEAMLTDTPIVTTDLDFSHDACHNAALYYDPLDPDMAAEEIIKIINSQNIKQSLLNNARKVLAHIPTSRKKYLQHVRLIKHVMEL